MSCNFRTRLCLPRTLLASVIVLLSGLLVPSLRASEGSIVLRGSVVSSVDGTPIRAALVQLFGEQSRAILTGADGAFEFDGLATGDRTITVRKPGYFSAQQYYPESVGEQRVHLAPNLQPIELKLYPEAMIYGRLTNESGRPLEGITVHVMRSGAKNGAGESLPTATTNENGEYRLAELKAGTYLLTASQSRMVAAFSIAMLPAAKLRTGYPTSFYPGVTDLAQAAPLRLTPGKKLQADLQLTLRPLYRVSGSVLGASDGGAVVVVLVSQQDVNPVAAATVTPGLNHFVLEGVPAGSYFIGAVQEPREGAGEQKTGISRIEVTQNMDAASVVLAEKRPITVRFRYQNVPSSTPAVPPRAHIASLVRTDLSMPEELFAAALVPNPENAAEGLPIALEPGTYHAVLNPERNSCVASIESGSVNMLSEDLLVPASGSAEPIEVLVRGDCAQVQGTISKSGMPSMGRVLAMPADGLRNGASTAADSDGAFRFQGLAPGKYFVVALDGADGLDLSNSGTLAKLQSLATEVDVQASAEVNVRLELKSLEP